MSVSRTFQVIGRPVEEENEDGCWETRLYMRYLNLDLVSIAEIKEEALAYVSLLI